MKKYLTFTAMSVFTWLSAITTGFTNIVFEDPEVEKMAHRRAEVCATSGENGEKCERLIAVKGRGIMCNHCYCVISAKVRVPGERCPLGRWEQETLNQTQHP